MSNSILDQTDDHGVAYGKGYDDCWNYRKRDDRSLRLSILNHPYEIPNGYERAYWSGWNAAEEEFRQQQGEMISLSFS